MNQHLHVNKSNFDMKDFALGLTLKQRHKTTQKWSIGWFLLKFVININ